MGADGIVQAAELLLLDESSLKPIEGDAMNPEAEKLYNLLPALYRIRDAEQGGALKALCDVIAEEIAVLRENLDQLYDDQFIETCAEWVAPYIGDLIGYRPLHGVTARTLSARAEVANTIAYRRRKGTATVLEQLARDVTGWNARAVEFFQWLETSQYMNHIRPANARDSRLAQLGSVGTARHGVQHDCAFGRHAPHRNAKGPLQYSQHRLVSLALRRLFADAIAGVSHRRRALHVQPARQRHPVIHPAARAKPISPISPSRSTCRSRSAGACCTVISTAITGEQLSLFVEATKRRYRHRQDSHLQSLRRRRELGAFAGERRFPSIRCSAASLFRRAPAAAEERARDFSLRLQHGHGRRRVRAAQEFCHGRRRQRTVTQGQQSAERAQLGELPAALSRSATAGVTRRPWRLRSMPTRKMELRAANEHRPALVLGGDLKIELDAGSGVDVERLADHRRPLARALRRR